jgi:uncharacterized protein YecE (DUF72 family)
LQVPGPELRVGISGWRYRPWRGVFYPKTIPQRAELDYASRRFGAIEINGTFYSLQRPESFLRWRAATPPGFVFAIKGSRYITHMKKLREVETPLANFLASGVLALGDKLGPFLWQFPPNFGFEPERLASFFELLPRDGAAALALARHHDQRLAGRSWLEADPRLRLRHAIEIRHKSFEDPAFVALLRRHDIALVFADAVDWPYFEDLTTSFVYARLHGSLELYTSGYSDEALERWAERVRLWSEGREPADAVRISSDPPPRHGHRDVFVFFDNDAKVRAPFDAMNLERRLGLPTGPDDLSSAA